MKVLRSDLPSTGVTTMSEEAMVESTYHGSDGGAVEHQLAVGLAAVMPRVERPHLDPQPPAIAVAFDVKQMIARATVFAVGRCRGGGHSQDRNGASWPVDARDLALVIVTVQDELATDPPDHGL